MPNIAMILILFIAISCSSGSSKTAGAEKDTITKITYPVEALHILTEDEDEAGEADLRFSIAEITQYDSITTYKILSTYHEKEIGFELDRSASQELKGSLEFKSTGSNSDYFLHVLSGLYKEKIDSAKKFTGSCIVTFIDLNEFARQKLKSDIPQVAGLRELKLFFESGNENNYAELYLNINEKEHWIEIREKDAEYRKPVLGFLAKQ